MKYTIVKEHGMNIGVRCAYRIYQATDSTRFLHGHSLGFAISLSCEDEGKLKNFIEKTSGWMDEYLEEAFSYAVIVSTKDPYANVIAIMETEGLADLRWMVGVGLRDFAQMIKDDFSAILHNQTNGEIWIDLVSVVEHQANMKGLA